MYYKSNYLKYNTKHSIIKSVWKSEFKMFTYFMLHTHKHTICVYSSERDFIKK